MTSVQLDLLESLRKELLEDCNKHVNGYCLTSACLKRGGWKAGDLDTWKTAATCTRWEQSTALKQLLDEADDSDFKGIVGELRAVPNPREEKP